MTQELTLSEAVDRVSQLLNESDARVEFEAGVAFTYFGVRSNIHFSADYAKLGEKIFRSANYQLHKWICDGKSVKPPFADILSGNNQREAIVAILAAVAAKLEVSLSIAVPITAMLIKRGLEAFCRSPRPKRRIRLSTRLSAKTARGKK